MAGFGFDVQKSPAFKNKQWEDQDAVTAITDSAIAKNIANSPIAKGITATAIAGVKGVAAVPAAFMDVANKAANAGNYLLGGNINYFPTDNTSKVLGWNPQQQSVEKIAGVTTKAQPDPVVMTPIGSPNVSQKTKVNNVATPVIAGGIKKQVGQPDVTVDQYLTQIAGDQAAGRQTGKMPRGVTGSVQVVGDTMDDRFQPGPKNGAVLTDAGYYTGSGFGNSPLASGGGKTRMSEIAGAADQANQFRQQQAVARQQQIANSPQKANVPSVDDYLDKIDPMVRGLSPMRALRIANESRNNDLKMQLAGQEINQRGQQHAADLQQKREAIAAQQPLHDAQAGYYNSHAKLMEAQSSPEYLMRQERIAGIKDAATRAKEMQKMQQDMATKWVQGQTGMQHPDDVKTAMSYIGAQDTFNQSFDAFVDKLPAASRKFWVDGFKTGEPSVLDQLARRGIVKPSAPVFPARNPSTLGMQPQEAK